MTMKKILIISLLIAFSSVTLSSCDRKSKIDGDVSGQQSTDTTSSENQKTRAKGNAIIWGALIVSLFANAGFTMVCFVRMDEYARYSLLLSAFIYGESIADCAQYARTFYLFLLSFYTYLQ